MIEGGLDHGGRRIQLVEKENPGAIGRQEFRDRPLGPALGYVRQSAQVHGIEQQGAQRVMQ